MATPDAVAWREYFESPRFRSGAARGKWRLMDLAFPYAVVEIQCLDGRYVALRFEGKGYPHTLPTAQVWDAVAGVALPFQYWPRGEKRINAVFRTDWKAGTSLYLPCDRHAIEGHTNWASEHPETVWDPEKGLCIYLEAVYLLLQTSDFSMVKRNG